RTVAAWTVRVPRVRASSRESLVFIATHFKLPGHVVDSFFELPAPGAIDAGFRRLQGKGPAAAGGEAAGPRPLHHLPFDRHGLPPAAAPQRPHDVYRRGVAEKLRGGRARSPARRADEEPSADDAAGARGGRHRIPS